MAGKRNGSCKKERGVHCLSGEKFETNIVTNVVKRALRTKKALKFRIK